MNKIESFSLSRLHNNEHFQFMSAVDVLIILYTASVLGIVELYVLFKQALTAEDTAMKIERGSSRSKVIADLQKLRFKTWNAIRLKISAYRESPIPAEAESGEALWRTFILYGKINRLSYNEGSSAITNLVGDLQKAANTAHLTKTGLTEWVSILKTQNEQFVTVFNQRDADYASRPSGDVGATRVTIDAVYEDIVAAINASITLKEAPAAIEPCVNELNQKISYLETTLAARETRAKKASDKKKAAAAATATK